MKKVMILMELKSVFSFVVTFVTKLVEIELKLVFMFVLLVVKLLLFIEFKFVFMFVFLLVSLSVMELKLVSAVVSTMSFSVDFFVKANSGY